MPATNTLKSRWQHFWLGWMNKRIPPAKDIQLHYRQIFIFPTKSGFGFALLLLIVMIGATNYQNNLAFALNFWLVSLGFLAIVHTFRNLLGLKLRCRDIAPVFLGDDIELQISLSADKPKQAIELGFTRQPSCRVANVTDTPTNAELQLAAKQRGWQSIPRIYIQTLYPLGIIHAWSWVTFANRVLVYPKPVKPPHIQAQLDESGDDDQGNTLQIKGDEFHGHKTYSAGDSIKQIDWKVYARERGVMSRDLRAPQSSEHLLTWDAFPGADTELRLSYLCHQVLEMEKQQQNYALKLPGQTINLGSGSNHQMRCLKALALFGSAEDTLSADARNPGADNGKQ